MVCCLVPGYIPGMSQVLSELPRDIESLHALIAAQGIELAARDAERASAREVPKSKALEIEKLKVQLARLRRMTFGRSSERLTSQIEQLELVLEDLEAEAPAEVPGGSEGTTEEIGEAKPPRKTRRQLPGHLPRADVRHDPDGSCRACGGEMRQVGADVTGVLDYVPGRFRVIRHVRPALGCRVCETMVQEPMPSLPIERGMASPALLAHVLINKYADRLPLYRQSRIFAREGVELPRMLLASWVGKCADLLRPWSRRSRPTSWPPPISTATTRQCRCSTRAGAGRGPGGNGSTWGLRAGPKAVPILPPYSTAIPRTARGSIRRIT